MKRSHKLKAMGDVQSVIDRSPDLSAAARELGVDRSTITRWLQRGKITARPEVPLVEGKTPPAAPTVTTWSEWAPAVKDAYDLSPTDLQLVTVAAMALEIAYDPTEEKAIVRLAAMARFAALVKQLNLQQSAGAGAKPGATAPPRSVAATPAQARPVRASGDPRAILMAVK